MAVMGMDWRSCTAVAQGTVVMQGTAVMQGTVVVQKSWARHGHSAESIGKAPRAGDIYA